MKGLRARLASITDSSRRITTSGEWIREVDGVRFVAIMLVLIQHMFERVIRRSGGTYPGFDSSVAADLLRAGHVGVLIFFTLSGYILARILMKGAASRDGIPWGRYYWRRLTRLEPPYFIVMTGIFLAVAITGYRGAFTHSFQSASATPAQSWLLSAVYMHGFVLGEFPKLNPPAWSLEIEVQFYVLAPLAALLLVRMAPARRIAAIVTVMLGWALTLVPWSAGHDHLRSSLLGYLPYFAGGFAVLEIQRILKNQVAPSAIQRTVADFAAVAGLLTLITSSLWIPDSVLPLALPLASMLFVGGGLLGDRVRRMLALRPVAVIGGMCYSIYLIHLPLFEVAANHTVRFGVGLPIGLYLLIQGALLIPFALVIAWVFFRLVEQPCMNPNWPKDLVRALRRRSGMVAAEVAAE